MEELRYQSLLQDEGTFKAVDKLSFVEAYNYNDSTLNVFRKGEIFEEGIEAWMKQMPYNDDESRKPQSSLRIIACTQFPKYGGRRLPLSLSRKSFEMIFKHWNLPQSFLYLSSTRRSCFSSFEKDGTAKRSYIFQTTDKGGGGRPFSCAISHCPLTNSTLLLLYGLIISELDILCAEIKESLTLISLPTFIPHCLLEMKAELVDTSLHSCHTEIRTVKVLTGMTRGKSTQVDKNDELEEDFQFVNMSRTLTRLSATLAQCELACEAHLMLLESMEKENEDLLMNATDPGREHMEKVIKAMKQKTNFLKGWMQALGPRTKCLSQRAQAYVQTIYSLLAQKDNALNIQTAEASLRVSEASYRDSAAMKAIAEDSKQVALATSRDSAVMVILAILTTVFLPATFTATLFSTTFFDFRKEGEKTVVSAMFWIYWVVTLSLTVLTMTCAGYFWRVRDRKMRLAFEKGREELEKIQHGTDSMGKAVK